jgi:hypothetical protein
VQAIAAIALSSVTASVIHPGISMPPALEQDNSAFRNAAIVPAQMQTEFLIVHQAAGFPIISCERWITQNINNTQDASNLRMQSIISPGVGLWSGPKKVAA